MRPNVKYHPEAPGDISRAGSAVDTRQNTQVAEAVFPESDGSNY